MSGPGSGSLFKRTLIPFPLFSRRQNRHAPDRKVCLSFFGKWFNSSGMMELSDAVSALASLAQTNRLEIFRLLVRRGSEGMGAGDLAAEIGLPKPTLSFHLKELVNAGLIESERSGRSIRYRLREAGMRQLMVFLTEDCCQGRPELCLPAACGEEVCAADGC